jgi:phosphatidylserine/phosphatidylglycerophosphate/cardiolipin synthase-like enzyme
MPTPPQGEEPVHSHFKLALVDCEFAMFGSGNMDRASWYTSQELGILFYGREFCTRVKAGVDGVLEGRLEMVFDSDERRD